VFASLIFVLS
jgi:Sugar (and other) transporter